MGGFIQGFLHTAGERGRQALDKREEEDRAQKQQQAKVYWDAIQSGRLSPEQLKYAQDQLQKLYPKSKGIKDVFGKLGQVFGMVHPQGGEAQGKGATVSPPPGASGNAMEIPKVEPIPNAKPGDGPKTAPIPNASGPMPKPEPLKAVPPPPPSFASMVSAAHPNPDEAAVKERETALSDFKARADYTHKLKMEEEKQKAEDAAKSSKGIPRTLSPLSMSQAQKMASGGTEFKDAAGEPIDVSVFDHTMQLVPVIQGNKTFYVPTSQHQTHFTVGNQVIAVPALEQMNAGTESTPLGPARTGTTGTHEVIGVDANGNPIKQTLTTTRTPDTPGVNKGEGSVSPPPGAQSAPKQQPAGTAKGKPQSPAPASGGRSGPKPAYMTPAMYKSGIERVTPIREAATQVLGDPTQPELKSLKDYAYVADDPAARDRVGKAIRLTFDGLEDGHVPHSQIMQLVSMKVGLPQMLAGAKAEQLQEAIGGLKPDEQKLYNKVMSAYGAIIGLRSLTKAGSSNFSMQKIEQEAPIPGLNATNAKQMYDQLANLAEIIYNGTRTLPDTIMPKDEKEYFKNQVGELLALSNGKKPSSGVQPPPGAKGQPKTADDYLNMRKKKQ